MGDTQRIEFDDFIIIKLDKEKIPLDCPSCGFAFSTREDILSYKINGCCEECDLLYRKPNIEKWNMGWRPKKSDSSFTVE